MNLKKTEIAILGATSHIAKGLIYNFFRSGGFSLRLFARSPEKVRNFLAVIGKSPDNSYVVYKGFDDFLKGSYDAVINCVGAGTINKLGGDYSKYFTVIEEYDNLAIKYLRCNHARALYISFSSGAVYGREFSAPAEENTINSIRVNHVAKEDYYSVARLNSEVKHRSFKDLNIIDLRLFSYFSRFIDLTDSYFIAEIMNCILNKKTLLTNDANFVRDYVHPEDLFSLIKKCLDIESINRAFDVMSAKPAEKREILDYFSQKYGLRYEIDQSLSHASATGSKSIYYSKYINTIDIGHKPAFSSMGTIEQESKYILSA